MSTNRGRITLITDFNELMHEKATPPGYDYVAMVSVDEYVGPLIRNKVTGIYAQYKYGTIRTINQRKAELVAKMVDL